VLVVTCLDHRVDPAIVPGLKLGETPVIRNAGGRVTEPVIEDIAYLAFLAEQLFAGQVAPDRLFEAAVIHHTQCGTSLLGDPGFRHQAAAATGQSEARWRPPRSWTRTSPSRPASSACSPRPASRRR
jgi:carbonic anhydrase